MSLLLRFKFIHSDYQILKSGFKYKHSEKDIDKLVFKKTRFFGQLLLYANSFGIKETKEIILIFYFSKHERERERDSPPLSNLV